MKPSKDSLGDRMKTYEAVTKTRLVRRMPVIIRVDGKAFHTLTAGMERPFDLSFVNCMHATAKALCAETQNADFAYVQSDEISVLVTDYHALNTEAWFDNQVQKIVSIAAACATAHFGRHFAKHFPGSRALPMFDARTFNVPADDVANYFLWRQQDAIRNSIQAVGQANFSQKELHGVNCNQIQELLFQRRGINWADFAGYLKRGAVIDRKSDVFDGYTAWGVSDAPEFGRDRAYTNKFVFPAPDDEEVAA